MTTLRMSAATLGLSTALALLSVQGAMALEAKEFGARLKTASAEQGVDLDWTGISVDGDQVTLEEVTAGAPGVEERVPLGQIVFEEVTEEGGGYRIGSLAIPSYAYSLEETNVALEGLTMSGLTVPGEDATGPMADLMMYESAEIESMTIAAGGAQVFAMSGVSIDVSAPQEDAPLDIAMAVDEFTADLSQAEDPRAREAIEALGYSTISGGMEMAAQWTPQDGRATLERFDIAIEDAGTLGISFDLGGYTAELAKTLQEMQVKMESASEEEKAAQGMAMLGLMQQLTFHGATIRFDDASLTGKVLDYVAEQQGMQRADIANLAKAVLPLYLSKLDNPEFSESVTAAVSEFLDDPQSFTVSAEPDEPVPFALLFAGAMTAPQSLIGQLRVTVSANEAE